MKSIVVTVCMLPLLPVAVLVVILLSVAPLDSRPRKFRSWVLTRLA
jgi:hypothetical protein